MSRETAWHVTSGQAAAYADGSLPEPDAWSVELHVEACTDCARRVSGAVASGAAGPALRDVRAGVLAAIGEAVAGAEAESASPADADGALPADGREHGRPLAGRPQPSSFLSPGGPHGGGPARRREPGARRRPQL